VRTFSTSILAALVICALFWGNCFSCPQMLRQQAHRCCPHSKQSNCTNQSLRQFVKADPGSDVPTAAVPVAAVQDAPAAAVQLAEICTPVSVSVHAPPGPFSLRI